jgi:coatomer subunit beta'
MISKLADSSLSGGKNNVAFLSHFIRGDLQKCLDLLVTTNRLPEASFFAREEDGIDIYFELI